MNTKDKSLVIIDIKVTVANALNNFLIQYNIWRVAEIEYNEVRFGDSNMDRIIYRVSEVKTLEEIAQEFHTTPTAIARLNNLDGEVFIGMRLLIQPQGGEYYVVQPFDTIASIAKKFGTTEERIAEFNSERVFIGQKIFIVH